MQNWKTKQISYISAGIISLVSAGTGYLINNIAQQPKKIEMTVDKDDELKYRPYDGGSECVTSLDGLDSSLYVRVTVSISSPSMGSMHPNTLVIAGIDYAGSECFDLNEDEDAYEMDAFVRIDPTRPTIPFVLIVTADEDLRYSISIKSSAPDGEILSKYEKNKSVVADTNNKSKGMLKTRKDA